MKKIISTVLLVCLLIPAFAFAEGNDWQETYRSFIENKDYTAFEDVEFNDEYAENVTFAVYELSGDEVPELLVFNGSEIEADAVYYLYTITDGSAEYVDICGSRIESGYRYGEDEDYTGLFYDYIGNGVSSVSYLYLTNDGLQSEIVKSEAEGAVTRETSDDGLYHVEKSAGTPLNFRSKAEIDVFGWEAFFTGSMDEEAADEDYEVIEDEDDYKYVVTTASVKLRTTPMLDDENIVTAVGEGTTLNYRGVYSVDERGVKWYGATYDAEDVWVSSKYSKRSNTKGFGTKTEKGDTVYITGSSVNVRAKADKDSKNLGTVHGGDTLTYNKKTATDSRGIVWYQVKYKGKTGWVSSKMASLGTSKKSSKSVVVTSKSAYVRKDASKDAQTIKTVHKDDVLTYLNNTKTDSRGVKWYQVSVNGKSGWISSKMCKLK